MRAHASTSRRTQSPIVDVLSTLIQAKKEALVKLDEEIAAFYNDKKYKRSVLVDVIAALTSELEAHQ